MKFITLSIFLSIISSDTVASGKYKFELEVSPAYFLMNGFGVDFLASYKNQHSLGASLAKSEFPNEIARLFFDDLNSDKEVIWKIPYSLQYRYIFNQYSYDSPLLGLAIGKEEWFIKSSGKDEKIKNIFTSIYLSYKKNISNNTYLMPTFFILHNSDIKGENGLHLKKTSIAVNLSFGYQF